MLHNRKAGGKRNENWKEERNSREAGRKEGTRVGDNLEAQWLGRNKQGNVGRKEEGGRKEGERRGGKMTKAQQEGRREREEEKRGKDKAKGGNGERQEEEKQQEG
jgi:hypothetical protein